MIKNLGSLTNFRLIVKVKRIQINLIYHSILTYHVLQMAAIIFSCLSNLSLMLFCAS